jgi:hypothetical protein
LDHLREQLIPGGVDALGGAASNPGPTEDPQLPNTLDGIVNLFGLTGGGDHSVRG